MRCYMLSLIFATYIYFIESGQSADVNKCIFPNDTKHIENEKLMNIISPIIGQNFMTEKNSYSYMVSICSDVSKDHVLGTVIRSKISEGVVVLGRRNDTQLIQGDNWMVLVFGSGDYITGKKETIQRRVASIYLVCDPNGHDNKMHLQLVQEDGRNYIFILPTESVCNFNEEMSGMKIFLIFLSISFSVYCLLGITYRRFVHNAKYCQQIPHFMFWSRIGNKLADGCSYVCRCDSEPEVSWNAESGDQDEPLLLPWSTPLE